MEEPTRTNSETTDDVKAGAGKERLAEPVKEKKVLLSPTMANKVPVVVVRVECYEVNVF